MARPRKTATIDPNMVSIADFCQSQGINEQIFRLELMPHLDNADSAKVVEFDLARSVAEQITSSKAALPAQTSNTAETTAKDENLTPSELEASTETAPNQPQKPQNSDIVASAPSTPSVPGQGQNKPVSGLPSALEELLQESEEVIQLSDLIHTYRNQQILQNADARDSELVVKLRERRIETRNQVFDSLRNLNQKQPTAPELPELPASLSDEIKSLSDELGKSLKIG